MFQEYLKREHSEKVAKGYIKDYLDFLEFVKEKQLIPQQATETDIREYIHWLRENNCANSTVTKKISLLRKYFKWLRKNGEMIHNPMDDIQQPKVVEQKREVSNEERNFIWGKVMESKNIRDQVIFGLLMNDGVKPSEMIRITYKDCDLDKRLIYLENSGAFVEKRAITISEETAKQIKELKDVNQEGFLLTNQHGHPLKESGIYFVINEYLSSLNDVTIKPKNLMKVRKAAN
ncbi:site-specific integrase [Priestia sp. SB1]|uniref:tyrosine-type recombinase/integrase n=1 Tax=Priestia sp. SB1 TaxID=3132359 RepID=UPI0031771ECE